MSPRSRGTQAPRLGIQRALIAPGIATQAPTQPSNMALQLQQLFGVAASTAGAAAQFAGIQAQISGERKRARDVEKTRAFAAAAEGTVAIPEFETKAVSDAFWQNQAHKTLATLDLATLPRLQGEDYAAAMHRWMGKHTHPTAPPVYYAVLMEGGRKQVAAQVITDARQAQVAGLNDVKSATRRTFSSDSMADARNMFAGAWTSLVVANKLSDDEKYAVVLEAANEVIAMGWKKRAEQIEQFLIDEERPSLAVGIVGKATKVFQTNQFNEAMPQYEQEVEDGRPLDVVLTEIKMREKTGDFSHGHRTALENYLRHVAQGLSRDHIYGLFRAGALTDEATLKLLNDAVKTKVFSEPQALNIQRDLAVGRHHVNRMAKVQQRLSGDMRITLTHRDDDAILGAMKELGYSNGQSRNPNGTGNEFWGVPQGREEQWAQFLATTGVVPRQVSEYLGSALAGNDRGAVAQSLVLYSMLQQADQKLADDVFEQLDETGRIRASLAIITPMEAATELSADPEKVLGRGPSLDTIMLVEPKPYSKDDLSRLIINAEAGETARDEDVIAAIRQRAMNELPHHLVKEKGWFKKRQVPKYEIDKVPRHVARLYIQSWNDRFRALAAIPGIRETQAAAMAHTYALNRAIATTPPMLWRERIMWLNGGPEPPEDAEDQIEAKLRQHFDEGQVMRIMGTHVPTWREDLDGITLHHDTSPLTDLEVLREGRLVPFVWRPGTDTRVTTTKPRKFTQHDQNRVLSEVAGTLNALDAKPIYRVAAEDDVRDALERYGGDSIAAEAYLNKHGMTADYDVPAPGETEK